jgi:hypothetical protein
MKQPPPPRRHFSSPSRSNRPYQQSSGRGHDSLMDSTGPAGKIRGTAQQILEKYMNLGRDSLSSGDYVMSESFFQYAEHYRRIISVKREEMQERQERQERQAAAASVDSSSEEVPSVTKDITVSSEEKEPSPEVRTDAPLHLSENQKKVTGEGSLDQSLGKGTEVPELPAFLSVPTKQRRTATVSREKNSASSEEVPEKNLKSQPKERGRLTRSKVKPSDTKSLEE